jgi:hypothetical protein
VSEQQASLLTALLDAGAVAAEGQDAVRKQVAAAQAEVERYSVEKKEILEGSAAVGPAAQVLEVDGEKGKVVGTKVWESTLGAAGDQFDMSTLWLQLSLVLGAVSLVLQADKPRCAAWS